MKHENISVDEFIATQKGAVKSGDIVLKGFKAPSSWDPEKRTARFTISAQTEDRDRDIILQDGLDTRSFEQNPVALMFHNSRSWPIGRWSDITKNLTGRPKRTEAQLNLLEEGMEPDADRAAKHIAAGTLTTCSIGFIPRSVKRREAPDDKKNDPYYWSGYLIEEAELVEVSIVPVPSLREAAAKAAGGGDDLVMPREVIEEILDNWTKHPETGLLMPRSELELLHHRATGERTSVVVPSHNAGAPEATPGAEPAGPRERSLVRRALQGLIDAFAKDGEALIVQAEQAELAAQEIEEQRKAEHAARVKQTTERLAAIDERLRSKGLINESA